MPTFLYIYNSARIHKYSWGILIWNRVGPSWIITTPPNLIFCKISGAQNTWTTTLNLIISHSEFSHLYADWHNFLHTSIRRITNGLYGFPTKTRGPFTWTNLHKAIPVSLTCTRLLPPLGLPNLFTWPERRQIPEGWDQLLG